MANCVPSGNQELTFPNSASADNSAGELPSAPAHRCCRLHHYRRSFHHPGTTRDLELPGPKVSRLCSDHRIVDPDRSVELLQSHPPRRAVHREKGKGQIGLHCCANFGGGAFAVKQYKLFLADYRGLTYASAAATENSPPHGRVVVHLICYWYSLTVILRCRR